MVALKGCLSVLVLGALASAGLATSKMTLHGFSLGVNTDEFKVNVTPYLAGPVDCTIGTGSTFETFSADLGHAQSLNQPEPFTIESTESKGSGFEEAARLLNAFGASAGIDPLKNAALQQAIWSVLYPTYSFSDFGSLGVTAQASIYLNTDVSKYSDKANYYNFGGKNMNQMGPAAVPEPAPFVALLGVFLFKRRRR